MEIFIDLSHGYLSAKHGARTTSFGFYIENKLRSFLPSISELSAVYRDKVKDGELGKVYLDLLVGKHEEREQEAKKRSRAAMEAVVKIEDDD